MRFSVIAVFFLLFSCTAAFADKVTLAWDDPDNPPGAVAGYNVYQGTVSGAYEQKYDAGQRHVFTTPDLPPGTYYFAVSAYNASNESPKSAEVSADVQAPIVLKAPATIIIRVE